MNADCLDIVAEWAKTTFPNLKPNRITDVSLPLVFELDQVWVVSVQFYKDQRKVSAWNPSGNEGYLIWIDPADPQFFAYLEEFFKQSIAWVEALTPEEKSRKRVFSLGG